MKMNYKHGFSYTFERVQENSEKLWRFERYTVINDYEWRIPSPINIAFLPYRFFCCPMRKRGCLNICRGKSKWLCCFHNIQLYIHGLSQNCISISQNLKCVTYAISDTFPDININQQPFLSSHNITQFDVAIFS